MISWFGHSCFYLESKTGTKILTDPYGAKIGYPPIKAYPDIITISHEHWDHNSYGEVPGSSVVLHGIEDDNWKEIKESYPGVRIETVPSYHDDAMGSKRKKNTIFVFDIDGLKVVHLGDLGHLLTLEQINRVGKSDIVLIPVGGNFTIGPQEAHQVVEQLKPSVVVPMHYKTEATVDWPIAALDDFLMGKSKVKHVGQKAELNIDFNSNIEYWLFSYK